MLSRETGKMKIYRGTWYVWNLGHVVVICPGQGYHKSNKNVIWINIRKLLLYLTRSSLDGKFCQPWTHKNVQDFWQHKIPVCKQQDSCPHFLVSWAWGEEKPVKKFPLFEISHCCKKVFCKGEETSTFMAAIAYAQIYVSRILPFFSSSFFFRSFHTPCSIFFNLLLPWSLHHNLAPKTVKTNLEKKFSWLSSMSTQKKNFLRWHIFEAVAKWCYLDLSANDISFRIKEELSRKKQDWLRSQYLHQGEPLCNQSDSPESR